MGSTHNTPNDFLKRPLISSSPRHQLQNRDNNVYPSTSFHHRSVNSTFVPSTSSSVLPLNLCQAPASSTISAPPTFAPTAFAPPAFAPSAFVPPAFAPPAFVPPEFDPPPPASFLPVSTQPAPTQPVSVQTSSQPITNTTKLLPKLFSKTKQRLDTSQCVKVSFHNAMDLTSLHDILKNSRICLAIPKIVVLDNKAYPEEFYNTECDVPIKMDLVTAGPMSYISICSYRPNPKNYPNNETKLIYSFVKKDDEVVEKQTKLFLKGNSPACASVLLIKRKMN